MTFTIGFASAITLAILTFLIMQNYETQKLLEDRTVDNLRHKVSELREDFNALFAIVQKDHPDQLCGENDEKMAERPNPDNP